jgi:hypothetical protein
MADAAAQEALKQVDRLYRLLLKRRPEIEKNNRYYRGEQPLAYASAEWKSFHGDRYKGFSDNWCGVVANAPAERLRTTGFRLPSDDRVDSALSADEKTLWDWWSVNELDLQSSQGYLASIVSKRSLALVWGDDDDEPVVTWEDAAQMYLDVDPQDARNRRYALKVWTDGGLECATLYTPTEVWKFQRQTQSVAVHGDRTSGGLYVPPSTSTSYAATGGWQPRQPAGDDTWPIDNPMGVVPVVEFPNRPMLGGEPLSDIAGTIAMQDAINMLWAYLFVAADYASMPARVIMGQEPPKVPILDADGQKIGEKEVAIRDLAQGRLLWLTGQNTKVDQFERAHLDAFTSVIEVSVGHVGAQTRTPPHYLVSNKGLSNLSGDALKAAETGLVKRVEEEQLFLSPASRELFRLMALAAGRKDLAEKARRGVPQWKDAESRSEAQLVDALQKLKAIGFPFQWLAERYGLSQTEVVRLVQLKQAEQASDLFGAAAEVVAEQQAAAEQAQEPASDAV